MAHPEHRRTDEVARPRARQSTSPVDAVLELQGRAGNAATIQLLGSAEPRTTVVQREKFSYGGADYDTDDPTPIWQLFDRLYRAHDTEGFRTLLALVEKLGGDLADELAEAWGPITEGDGEQEAYDEDEEEDEDDYYEDDEAADLQEKYGPGRKEYRATASAAVGQSKRVGKKGQRDKWYGMFANNPDAQEWWHLSGKKQHGHGQDMTDASQGKVMYAFYEAERG